MCQGFLHAISSLQNTSYQLSLGHLDHVELLILRVLELQMTCFTKVFIKTSFNMGDQTAAGYDSAPVDQDQDAGGLPQ